MIYIFLYTIIFNVKTNNKNHYCIHLFCFYFKLENLFGIKYFVDENIKKKQLLNKTISGKIKN